MDEAHQLDALRILRGEEQLQPVIAHHEVLRVGTAGTGNEIEPGHRPGRVHRVEFRIGRGGGGEIQLAREYREPGRIRQRGIALRGVRHARRRTTARINPQPDGRPIRRDEIQLGGQCRQGLRIRAGGTGVEVSHELGRGSDSVHLIQLVALVGGTRRLGRDHQLGTQRGDAVEVRHGIAPGGRVKRHGRERIRGRQAEQAGRYGAAGRANASGEVEVGSDRDVFIEVRAGHHTDAVRGAAIHLEEQGLTSGIPDVVERVVEVHEPLRIRHRRAGLADVGNILALGLIERGRGEVSRPEIQRLARSRGQLRGIGDGVTQGIGDLVEHRAAGGPESVDAGIDLHQVERLTTAAQGGRRARGQGRRLRRGAPRQQHRHRHRPAARALPERVSIADEVERVADRREVSRLGGERREVLRPAGRAVREVELPRAGGVFDVIRHQVEAVAHHGEIHEILRQRALTHGRGPEEELHALDGFRGIDERQIRREIKLADRDALVGLVLIRAGGHLHLHIAGIRARVEELQRCPTTLLEELELDRVCARRQGKCGRGKLCGCVQPVVVHPHDSINRQPAAVIRAQREGVVARRRDIQEAFELHRIIRGALARPEVGLGDEAGLLDLASGGECRVQRLRVIHHRVGVRRRNVVATRSDRHKPRVVARHRPRRALILIVAEGEAVRGAHIQGAAIRQQREARARPGNTPDIGGAERFGPGQHGDRGKPDVFAGLTVTEGGEAIPALVLTRAENVAVVIREAVAIQIRIEEAGGSTGADVH